MLLENKRFIAIDLELEQPFSKKDCPDSQTFMERVIQLGFVVVEIGEEPVFLHEEVIHLAYSKPISSYIKNLTSIKDEDCNSSQENALNCLFKLKHIREQYQCSRQLLQWGGGDDTALIIQANFDSLCFLDLNKDFGFARSSINVKHLFQAYAMANNIKKQSGLSKSMSKLNIPFVNTRYNGINKGAHWALTDAKNTAIMYNELIKLMKRDS